jgi:hypothetical protein
MNLLHLPATLPDIYGNPVRLVLRHKLALQLACSDPVKGLPKGSIFEPQLAALRAVGLLKEPMLWSTPHGMRWHYQPTGAGRLFARGELPADWTQHNEDYWHLCDI